MARSRVRTLGWWIVTTVGAVAVLGACGEDGSETTSGSTVGRSVATATSVEEELLTRVTDEPMTTIAATSGAELAVDDVPIEESPATEVLPEPPTTEPLPTVEPAPDLCEDGRQPVLVALERGSGERRWATCTPGDEEHALVAATSGVSLVRAYGRGEGPDPVSYVAVDSADGSELWTLEADSYGLPGVVLVDEESFYVLGLAGVEGRLAAVDVRTGERRWEVDGVTAAWDGEDHVVVLSPGTPSGERASLRGLDAGTGATVWDVGTDGSTPLGPGSSEAYANRATLFLQSVLTDEPQTIAIDMTTGEERWRAPFFARVAGDTAVLGGQDLEGFGPVGGWAVESGEELWAAESLDPASAIADGNLIRDGDLVMAFQPTAGVAMVDLRTGEPQWSDPLLDVVWSASDGSLLAEVGTAIALLDIETGEVEWVTEVRDPDQVGYVSGALIDGDTVIVSVVNNSGV